MRSSIALRRYYLRRRGHDEAAAAALGVSSRELRCLGALYRGPCSPSELAPEVKLTPATMTTLVDRLEAKDLVRRWRDTVDRRKVLVEQTEKAARFSADFYCQLARDVEAFLSTFDSSELRTILRFMQGAIDSETPLGRDDDTGKSAPAASE